MSPCLRWCLVVFGAMERFKNDLVLSDDPAAKTRFEPKILHYPRSVCDCVANGNPRAPLSWYPFVVLVSSDNGWLFLPIRSEDSGHNDSVLRIASMSAAFPGRNREYQRKKCNPEPGTCYLVILFHVVVLWRYLTDAMPLLFKDCIVLCQLYCTAQSDFLFVTGDLRMRGSERGVVGDVWWKHLQRGTLMQYNQRKWLDFHSVWHISMSLQFLLYFYGIDEIHWPFDKH